MTDFPRFDQIGNYAEGFPYRSGGLLFCGGISQLAKKVGLSVWPVQLINIDEIGLQAL